MKIAISGMTSSGKSTLTQLLAKNYGEKAIYLEEFDAKDELFDKLLMWHLNHKPNITLAFEIYVMNSHLNHLYAITSKPENANKILLMDRFSVEHTIFGKIAFADKSPKHYRAYSKAVNALITKESLPDLVIYLDLSFDSFRQRIFNRGRKSEVESFNANLEYWQFLYSKYKESFLKLSEQHHLNYQIIQTDNLDENQVFAKAKEIIEKFKNKQQNF
ncbi:deoxynucleoside kinase [Mycoplasmopsis sturni]|uniref:deoxynucleoside kinase n=1 Tax=Mycoplasmopsis sturni TaxID=39047 RepID=UPI000565D1B7|nr:deoxynucleoside kinase [Mycoplasmopsis sturni]